MYVCLWIYGFNLCELQVGVKNFKRCRCRPVEETKKNQNTHLVVYLLLSTRRTTSISYCGIFPKMCREFPANRCTTHEVYAFTTQINPMLTSISLNTYLICVKRCGSVFMRIAKCIYNAEHSVWVNAAGLKDRYDRLGKR